MTEDPSAAIPLRATVRDLLALSAIPEAWVAREPPAIAADLADLLIQSLELDFAFVRLRDPSASQLVEVTGGILGGHFRNGCNNTSLCSAKFSGKNWR